MANFFMQKLKELFRIKSSVNNNDNAIVNRCLETEVWNPEEADYDEDDDEVDDEVEEYDDEDEDEDDRIYLEWFDSFQASSQFEKLTQEQQENVDFILECFSEYLPHVDATDPADWNKDNIKELCLEVFPRKITAEISLFKHIAPVLIAFFNFLSEKKLLKQAAKLSSCINIIKADIPKYAADRSNWGMAKTFAMQALAEGVDLSDPVQNQKFLMRINKSFKNNKNPFI